ncbi:Purple acid phosphatase 17 (Acid phosphatase type 5) (Peroxidase), partial [Durusdinium trenchii]
MLRLLRFCICLPLLSAQEVDFDQADEACESETCQVSLRQLRAEKLQALGLSAGNAEASSATAQTEALGRWYVGLAHGYVAAGGKCYPSSAEPKTHMGLRRTGYCEPSEGPAMCMEGYCFCLEGSVFEGGKCQEPTVWGIEEGGKGLVSGLVILTRFFLLCTLAPLLEEEPEDMDEPEVDPDCGIPKAGSDCFKKVKWAMSDGIYANPSWYPGVTPQSPFTKFQDSLYRSGEGGCPRPCSGGLPDDPLHFPKSVLTRTKRGIKPPKHPFEYNGIEWPKMTIRGTNTHVFAVGDWGGLAGTLPHNSQIIQYKGGQTMGPHTMGRYRTDAKTHDLTCTTPEMSDCFGTNGTDCPKRCGWLKDVDVPAQHLVADQMIKRAKENNPDYLLNVGDNFYWGGIFGKCGDTPMSKVNDVTRAQFNWIYENVYKGPGLDGKPWLSVLGNHDWGGREMD